MPTPHNEAKKGDIAKIVLTSGDPKRCEYIAHKYLENSRLVNAVRGMTAYTGFYHGKEVTVFPMGMGMPSLGIYAYELFKFYEVDIIIRMGTCGTPHNDIDLLDTILLEGSYTESNFALAINRDNVTHLAYADTELNSLLEDTFHEQNISYKKGYGVCSEVFDVYLTPSQKKDMVDHFPKDIPILAVEMEAFALFYLAKMFHKKAACVLTVVDSPYRDEEISADVRERKLDNMIKVSLDTCLKL